MSTSDQKPKSAAESAFEDAPTRRLDVEGADSAASDPTLTATGGPPPSLGGDMVGLRVGKILVLELLGVGGMGRVYAGWDEKLERRVALKSIRRRHAPSDEVKARFLQEAQILSKLQHPNICQIYDYIEGEDNDYLVLELIEGQTLVDLPRGSLDDRDRLRLAVQLADVLASAHAAGVVHRDLKPANVMVTKDLQAKMLDFGIARSVGDDATRRPRAAGPRIDSSFETQAGFVVGTPQYMSPEQARGESATPASDMYSFGLLLQELFTGKPCYDPELSTLQLLGAVQEGKTQPVEGTEPEMTRLIERLKSPAQGARPSAPDTAEALRRIVDAPRRRRRKQLQIGAVVLLAIIAVFMAFQAYRIEQERQRAEAAAVEASREAETARQVLDVLLSLFEASDPWQADAWQKRGDELTVREVLARGGERLDEELPDRPLVRARLLSSLGEIHHKLGLFEDSRQLLESSLDVRRQSGAPPGEIAESLHRLAFLSQLEGDFDGAEALFLEELELLEADVESDPVVLARCLDRLGRLYSERGPMEKALPYLERALELRLGALGRLHIEVADSYHHLGNFNDQQGRLDEAERQLREALDIREQVLAPGHPFVAKTLNALGIVLDQRNDTAEAEKTYRRALEILEPRVDADAPQLASTRMNLGSTLRKMGDFDGAAALYEAALASFERRLGPDYPRVGEVLGNLGVLRNEQGRFTDAKRYFERARKIFAGAFGDRHPAVAMCIAAIARADLSTRRYRPAAEGFAEARGIFAATLGEDHGEVAKSWHNEAKALIELGPSRRPEAQRALEQALELGRSAFGDEHVDIGVFQVAAARLARLDGELDRARTLLDRAQAIFDAATLELRRQRSKLLAERANLAIAQGDLEQALEHFELAGELLHGRHGAEHPAWIRLLEEHASALRLTNRVDEAATKEREARRLASLYGVASVR